jgi:4-diphosphocytidyl-2-C-methyl-D-erythritol kinase
MLNTTIDLCDEMVVAFLLEPSLRIRVEPDGIELGPVEENLVARAFRYLWQELGISQAPIGLDCCITKKIPVGAGLGGGSSDAGAVLRLLTTSFSGVVCAAGSLSRADFFAAVRRAATRCGADVPYAYTGGLAWVSGVGEIVQPIATLPVLPGLIVIMVPPESVATAAFYHRFRERRPVVDNCIDPKRELFLNHPTYEFLQQIVENDFENEVIGMAPSVGIGLEVARRFFPGSTAVTGSGSAFFSLVPPGQEGKVPALEQELQKFGVQAICSRFVL